MARILCFGDSLTAGYIGGVTFSPYCLSLFRALVSTSTAPLPSPHIIDAIGFSGWTTDQMIREAGNSACTDVFFCVSPGLSAALAGRGVLWDYTGGAASRQPSAPYDLVIILAGTNDLANRGVTPERVFSNLQRLHEMCYAARVPRTLAVGIPQSLYGSRNSDFDAVRERTNALLEAWASGSSAGRCCYVPCPTSLSDLGTDGLHFSASGYETLGTELASTVCEMIASSSRSSDMRASACTLQ
jgi:lysophospholipase L1-like esterase